MRRFKLMLVGLVLIVMMVASAAVAHAAQNFRSGNDVTVSQGETIDKTLFATGRNLDIAGTVNGDIFCAGQTVDISGTVNGDIICAGQNVHISGTVNGNIRVAGQTVSLSGTVQRNLSVAAQDIDIETGGNVAGDASVVAQTAVFDGIISRDLAVGSNDVTVNGTVARDITAAVSTLTLGNSAVVGGNIEYTSAQSLVRAGGAKISGKITRNEPAQKPQQTNAQGAFLFALFIFTAFLLTALVLVLLFPVVFETITDVAVRQPLLTVLVGLAATVVVPLVIFVLLFSVIAIPLALLMMLVWVVILALAGPVAAYFLGRLLLAGHADNAVLYMLLGAVILLILSYIPILGVLIVLLTIWYGVGIILMQFRRLPKLHYAVPKPAGAPEVH